MLILMMMLNVADDDFDDLFSGLTTTLSITDWTLMGKLRTPSSAGEKGNDTGGHGHWINNYP